MSKWYEKANFYHIYPLGLCGVIHESKESKCSLECNKNKESNSLRSEKEGLDHNQFIKLQKWVPHLVNIGCNAIYIGPLFESETHGYDTIDYKKVDSRLGSNSDFKDYVAYCHYNGIKVIVDGVFNHTGREFFAFLDIKEKKQQSRYKDWYSGINFNGNSTYQDGFAYDGWRGHYNLVQLNLKNKEVRDYLFEVVKFWVEEFDIDGIRLDCADVLDFNFMRELRTIGDLLKKDFWLMGEVIHGDYSRWVNNEMLHSVTNYELHKGLYSGHNDHNYFEIAHTIKRLFDPEGGLCKGNLLYTFLDNHDVERIRNKLTNIEHIYPITILLYTLPGIPSIYYGSEWLIEGKKENSSDDSLRPMIQIEDYVTEIQDNELNRIQLKYHKEHKKIINLIIKLAGMRSNYDELAYGTYKELLLTNRQYSFARVLENSAFIVVVNNDEKEAILTIKSPIEGKRARNLLSGKEVELVNNAITLTLKANDGTVLLISEELD